MEYMAELHGLGKVVDSDVVCLCAARGCTVYEADAAERQANPKEEMEDDER